MAAFQRRPESLGIVPRALTAICRGVSATLTAQVSDPDGDVLVVVWTLNRQAIQSNQVPAGAPGTTNNVAISGAFPLGTNSLAIEVTDGTSAASCTTTVTVADRTVPVITNVVAVPNVLWPPNHKMVQVTIHASATDTCGPAVWKIVRVSSNEPAKGRGNGNKSPDWTITGDHTLLLRAERSGNGNGRVYFITVQATDASGNASQPQTVTMRVPKSQGKAKK